MKQKIVRVNTTLYQDMLKRVDFYAKQSYEDRSTAIRQLIAKALKEELKDKVINSYKQKKLTIREAAELIGIDYWEMQTLLEKEGVPVIDLTEKEIKNRL